MQRLGIQLFVALGVIACLMVAGTPAAHAEDAEALYKQGLKDMLAERYEEGCPALERSYQLDPLPGALFTLAACNERWGKVHAAATHYDRFVAVVGELPPEGQKKQAKRLATAKEKLGLLHPQVPTLTLQFATPPASDVMVTLDGQSVAPADLGEAQPVDPGEHVIVVRTGDGEEEEQVVPVGIGVNRTVTLSVPGEAPGADAPDATEDDGEGGFTGMHIGAVIAGSLGIVGLVVGGVTGGMVFAKKSEVDDACPEAACATEADRENAEEAQSLAMVSNIGFVVGGVGVAAGVLLWVLAPSLDGEEQDTAGVQVHVGGVPGDPASATVGLRGRF